MAGILSAIKLTEAGIDDVTVYEKADRLGGTWRENTYPGVACDVPSHLYSYSFAPNAEWSHFFSPGGEIEEYLEAVAGSYDVARRIRFGCEVTRLELNDGCWEIEGTGGVRDVADIVIAATGVLHHPSYPDIVGLDTFGGSMFHSSRWDHGVELAGRRVGVVGTGSSAVQIVSAIAGVAGELCVFQRTAQWVLQVANPAVDDADKESYRKDPASMVALHDQLSQWFAENFADAVVDAGSEQVKLLEQMCIANLEGNVSDPALREKLRPDYHAACKRLVISPNFYEAVQHPRTDLVTEAIAAVEKEGVRTADGILHELDVLVLATGFRVDRFLRPMEVIGRRGARLDDVWAMRPSAYLSISIPDFPNLFMLNGPNGPVGNFSLIEVAELQFDYVMQLIEPLLDRRCREIAATREAAERFEAERVEAAKKTIWMTGCRSWYLDDRGVPAVWPWKFGRFREEMAAPKLDDYELLPA